MGTRTKQGFEQLGFTHGTNGDKRLYPENGTSWQAKAYQEGWARAREGQQRGAMMSYGGRSVGKSLVAKEMLKQAVASLPKAKTATHVWFDELKHLPTGQQATCQGIDVDRMADNTKGWPRAAAEHATFLAKEINTTRDYGRQARLYRSLSRMQQRHGNAK